MSAAELVALTPAQLRKMRPLVGELMQAKIDELLASQTHSASASDPTATRMNRTEQAYAEQVLEPMKRCGAIRWYRFEEVKLRLADRTWYTPDFLLCATDGSFEFHEVKGFWREDARVKVKVVARLYPHFRFIAVQRVRERDGGGWKVEGFRGE